MNRTDIEWVRNPNGTRGFTSNPLTGCFGPGGGRGNIKRCPYCFAHELASTRLRATYLKGKNTLLCGCDPADPFSPRFWPGRLETLARRRKPAGIFLVDMGDLFGDWLPWEFIEILLEIVRDRPQHRWYLLTKNPKRYREHEPWPDNCWLGTTVTNQQDWDERWPEMVKVKAAVRFVSFEPLIAPILHLGVPPDRREFLPDWIIIGAMTGRRALNPPVKTVRQLTRFAAEWANIPIFHKDNLDCKGMGIERRREMPR